MSWLAWRSAAGDVYSGGGFPFPNGRLFEEGRRTIATTKLELNLDKFVTATNKFVATTNKRLKGLEDWQGVEDQNLEKEVTKAVKAYLIRSGFTDVRGVPNKKIIGPDGNILIEFDGLLAANKDEELFLVTVEAKHKVTTDKIQERVVQNTKFEDLLSELRGLALEHLEAKKVSAAHIDCCSALLRFAKANAEVLHYIGGVHFSEADINLAQKKKFCIVTRKGNAFHVTPYDG